MVQGRCQALVEFTSSSDLRRRCQLLYQPSWHNFDVVAPAAAALLMYDPLDSSGDSEDIACDAE